MTNRTNHNTCLDDVCEDCLGHDRDVQTATGFLDGLKLAMAVVDRMSGDAFVERKDDTARLYRLVSDKLRHETIAAQHNLGIKQKAKP